MSIMRKDSQKPEHRSIRGICIQCGVKPQSTRGNGVYRPLCSSCHREKYADKDKAKRANRNSMLIRTYGITLADYEAMLNNQNGVCAICGENHKHDYAMHVDHDHKTGKVRALLCHHCNNVLGHTRDNPDTLRKAIEYLAQHGIN